jgi:hypothetical protein
MYSYLQDNSSDTQYSYHTGRILFDEFSALCNGGVVIVCTFGFVWWVVIHETM